MSDEPSATSWLLAILGSGGAIGTVGKIVRDHMKWRRNRIAELETRVDELEPRITAAEGKSECAIGVCMLYGGRVRQLSPTDPVFRAAQQMVGTKWPDLAERLFGKPPPTDSEFAELLDRLDKIH